MPACNSLESVRYWVSFLRMDAHSSSNMCFMWSFRHITRNSRSGAAYHTTTSSSYRLALRTSARTDNMGDPLSPAKLLDIIQSAIIKAGSASTASSSSSSSSTAADPSPSAEERSTRSSSSAVLTNTTSLIALLVHSIHTALGFRQTRPAPPTLDEDGNTSQDPLQRNKVSKEWFENNSKEESFSFEYRHEQSSLVFQVRISRLGGRTVVNAVAVEVSFVCFARVQSASPGPATS